MGIVEVPVTQALAPSLLAGYDWALNPYRGCAFDCLYCYAPDVVRMERATWADTIMVKRAIPKLLAKELKRKEPGVIGISTVTDPYQPAERKLEVTRRCLEVIARAGWPVSVLTKSPLVTRDIDLLKRIPGAEVGFSIATGDDGERKRWESSCPPVQARMDALREVTKAGVRAYVFAGPLFPESAGTSMESLAGMAADAGAAEVIADTLHRRPGPLSAIIDATSPVPAGGRAERERRLLDRLAKECRARALPFSLAANWKPRLPDAQALSSRGLSRNEGKAGELLAVSKAADPEAAADALGFASAYDNFD